MFMGCKSKSEKDEIRRIKMEPFEWSAWIWCAIFLVMYKGTEMIWQSMNRHNVGTYRTKRFVSTVALVYLFIAIACVGWALAGWVRGL